MKHPGRDERDDATVDVEAINQESLLVMYSVFQLIAPLPQDLDVEAAISAVEEFNVTIRGWYDVAGFRAEADLMVWLLGSDPRDLQNAYHALRASELGQYLEPVWSNIGMHRPAEFNRTHVPSCFSGIAPRPWLCVYPFVRSYDWYYLDDDHRSAMLREHGMLGREFPDVLASTNAAFGMGDYEWLLAFEADELHRILDAMRHTRNTEARLHVREETPFFTGPRVELADWVAKQPRSA